MKRVETDIWNRDSLSRFTEVLQHVLDQNRTLDDFPI